VAQASVLICAQSDPRRHPLDTAIQPPQRATRRASCVRGGRRRAGIVTSIFRVLRKHTRLPGVASALLTNDACETMTTWPSQLPSRSAPFPPDPRSISPAAWRTTVSVSNHRLDFASIWTVLRRVCVCDRPLCQLRLTAHHGGRSDRVRHLFVTQHSIPVRLGGYQPIRPRGVLERGETDRACRCRGRIASWCLTALYQ
jgi:hypothetical protein